MEYSEYKDEELIRLSSRDEQAFNEIVRRYLSPLYNFIYRILKNNLDVEDIVQDAFLKAWKHAHTFRPPQKFKTWLYAIGHHAAIDHARKKRPLLFSDFETDDSPVSFADTIADTEALADEIFERAELKTAVETLLGKLPAPYREVILLRYHEELGFEDIASILGKPANTVKSQHRRALLFLKKEIDAAPKQPLRTYKKAI